MARDEANHEAQKRDLIGRDPRSGQPVRDSGADGPEEAEIQPLLDLVTLGRQAIHALSR